MLFFARTGNCFQRRPRWPPRLRTLAPPSPSLWDWNHAWINTATTPTNYQPPPSPPIPRKCLVAPARDIIPRLPGKAKAVFDLKNWFTDEQNIQYYFLIKMETGILCKKTNVLSCLQNLTDVHLPKAMSPGCFVIFGWLHLGIQIRGSPGDRVSRSNQPCCLVSAENRAGPRNKYAKHNQIML